MADQNVFAMLTDDPVEAAQLSLKSKFFMVIIGFKRKKKFTNKELARLLGIKKKTVKELLMGSLGQFSLDQLVEFAVKCNYRVETSFDKDASDVLIVTVTNAKQKA